MGAIIEIRLFLYTLRILLFECFPELIKHRPGKKRFCGKCIYA